VFIWWTKDYKISTFDLL